MNPMDRTRQGGKRLTLSRLGETDVLDMNSDGDDDVTIEYTWISQVFQFRFKQNVEYQAEGR